MTDTGQVAEEIAERALRRFLRGGTWLALAREIAWHALLETKADPTRLDALSALVEAKLAETVDELDRAIEPVCVAATESHLENWPHDREGAETIAVLDGQDEAMQVLGHVYVNVLAWAVAIIGERHDRERPGWLRLPWRAKSELPALVVQQLLPPVRFGWPRRDAA
jgi:hypothetical protein